MLIDELLIDVAGATQVLYETGRFQFHEPAMIFSLTGGTSAFRELSKILFLGEIYPFSSGFRPAPATKTFVTGSGSCAHRTWMMPRLRLMRNSNLLEDLSTIVCWCSVTSALAAQSSSATAGRAARV